MVFVLHLERQYLRLKVPQRLVSRQPENDLERPSSTRLEARFPYYDLRVKTRSPSPFAWRPDFLAAPREAH